MTAAQLVSTGVGLDPETIRDLVRDVDVVADDLVVLVTELERAVLRFEAVGELAAGLDVVEGAGEGGRRREGEGERGHRAEPGMLEVPEGWE